MKTPVLSVAQARALHLHAQGLLVSPLKKATSAAIRKCIAQMALLQIDTIHIVSRSPYLVLFSRLGHYPRHWLEEALAKGHIFETWAHEACFAPMPDLPLHRSYNAASRRHWGLANGARNASTNRKQLDKLLGHIRELGPVKSSDFERKDTLGGGWWGWKDEKRWLEALFAQGELMVARRENFHRVYDLTERVAPQIALTAGLSAGEVHVQFIERSIAALGITQARWVHDYFRLKPRLKDADLNPLVDAGCIQRVIVEGWEQPGYVHVKHRAALKKAKANALQANHTSLLSPFDPVVWDRERGSSLFGFDYRLECYTPEPKRVYGYFVLPILCRGELIGRLDAKAHRAEAVFEVKSLHTQDNMRWTQQQIEDVARAVYQCAVWHDTPKIQINRTHPSSLKTALERAIQSLR